MRTIFALIKRYPTITMACLTLPLAGLVFFIMAGSKSSPPTYEDYLAKHQKSQKIAPGQALLAGQPRSCGPHPSISDPNLDDFAAAHPGYLILNPTKMSKVSDVVQLYIFYHECGHQFVGPDENAADCYSVTKGRQDGWLSPQGMDQICSFIGPTKGSKLHPPGPKRCELMRQCYAKAGPSQTGKISGKE